MAEPLVYDTPFTSRREMESLLSSLGVDLRTEDAPEGLADYYADDATGDVLFYLAHVGPVEALAVNRWVRSAATVRGALLLTGHGGEPFNETLLARWERTEELLLMVLQRKATVPGFVAAVPHGGGPVIVNPRLDPQRMPPVRRVGPASTDVPNDWAPPRDYPTGYRGRS